MYYLIQLMKFLFRPFVRRFLNKSRGIKKYQKLFQLLHVVSIRGMNYVSGDFKTSGEIRILDEIAKKYTHGNKIIFDVGSNSGEYAIQIHRSFAKLKPTIFCFEPSTETYAALLANISDIDDIIPHNFGFSNKASTAKLYSYSGNTGLSSIYNRDLNAYGHSALTNQMISLTTIDMFCDEEGIDEIFFLKLDIEGNELNALKGASNMIASKRIEIIQFEFGEPNIDSKTFLRDFFEILSEYDLYRILRDGKISVTPYTETNEIFKTANFIAFLRK